MNDLLVSGVAIYLGTLVFALGLGVMVDVDDRISTGGFIAINLASGFLYFAAGINAPFAIPILLVVSTSIGVGRSMYRYRDSPLIEGETPLRKILISIAHPSRVRAAALDHGEAVVERR